MENLDENRELFEQQLIEVLMIAEATCEWSTMFYNIYAKYEKEIEYSFRHLFRMDITLYPITKLSQHYNQIYMNECIIHLVNLLSTDKSNIISLKKYGNLYFKKHKQYLNDYKLLTENFDSRNFKNIRNELIAHKNKAKINAVIESTQSFINNIYNENASKLIKEIAAFMKKYFIIEHIYIRIINDELRHNDYKWNYNDSLENIAEVIEVEIKKRYEDFTTKFKAKKGTLLQTIYKKNDE